ncbi:hypothetical protein SBA3_770024 [Candidatus Sulfopaludibacter sp. SbA3]|nr:hypothetical protein SBA3_770024 [Candidatus Sulfopaludibacter sp. SbA3]
MWSGVVCSCMCAIAIQFEVWPHMRHDCRHTFPWRSVVSVLGYARHGVELASILALTVSTSYSVRQLWLLFREGTRRPGMLPSVTLEPHG